MLKTLMAVENTFSELRLDKTQKQDQDLTVAHIMNSLLKIQTDLKKVEKTTTPFRYGLPNPL